MVYLIVVQGRSYNFDYSPLYDKIKSIGDDYIQAMDCLWFIHSDKPLNAKEVSKELLNYIGEKDFLFMSELPRCAKKDGRLLRTAWDFIKTKEL